MIPEKICPVCGVSFVPNKPRQIFHSAHCRVKASRMRRKGESTPKIELALDDRHDMLSVIRMYDPMTAKAVEDVALRAGRELAQDILLVCWNAMNRAADNKVKHLLNSGQNEKTTKKAKKAK